MAKKIPEQVDADALLRIMRPEHGDQQISPSRDETAHAGNEDQYEEKQPERKSAEEGRKRRTDQEELYIQLFIRDSGVSARSGKLIYVRKEYHDRIQRIIQVIGKNELSLFAYIDHVLTHHFEMYEEEIRKLYKKNYKEVY